MTGPSASWAVQLALHDALTNDPGLAAVAPSGVGVWDEPPEGVGFPFLTIGEARSGDYPGVAGAREHRIRIRAYSRWGGRAELKKIEAAVTAALDGAALPLDGHAMRQCRFVFSDIFRQPDRGAYQAVMRFRVVTEPSGANS